MSDIKVTIEIVSDPLSEAKIEVVATRTWSYEKSTGELVEEAAAEAVARAIAAASAA